LTGSTNTESSTESSQPTPQALIIYDWDGTLVDSIGLITSTLVSAAHALDEDLTQNQARHIIGLGLPEAIAFLFPNASQAFAARFQAQYSRLFIAQSAVLQPFAEAQAVLEHFERLGCVQAVATGKSRRGLDRQLVQLEWQSRFAATRCADETASKPHPLMLNQLMETLGFVAGKQVFMVGDTTFDLSMAQAAGVQAVAVSSGAHTVEALSSVNPHFIGENLLAAQTYIQAQLA